MKVVVFDMHGIIFSFSQGGFVDESLKILDKRVEELSKINHRYFKAFSDKSVYSEVENKVVKEAIAGRGELKVYEMDSAIDKLLELYIEGYQIVIVSESKVETSRIILEYLLRLKNDVRGSFQIVYSFDIYNSQDFGDKSDERMWREIFSKYGSIDIVYEDKMKYLEVAKKVVDELGFDAKFFSSV